MERLQAVSKPNDDVLTLLTEIESRLGNVYSLSNTIDFMLYGPRSQCVDTDEPRYEDSVVARLQSILRGLTSTHDSLINVARTLSAEI